MPGTIDGHAGHGVLAAAISNGIVGLLHSYTGRGPVRARTTIDDNLIVCVLGATLTKAEQALVENGKDKSCCAGAGQSRTHWPTTQSAWSRSSPTATWSRS